MTVQQGQCFYSRVPMECLVPNSHWRMTLERLDNEHGYTARNCVLAAAEFNTSDHSRNSAVHAVYGTAQWSRVKFLDVNVLRVTPIDISALTSAIVHARLKNRRHGCRGSQCSVRKPNELGHLRCSQCGTFKPSPEFSKDRNMPFGRRSICKVCVREASKRYYRTLRGNAMSLAGQARRRAQSRSQTSWLTFEDILDML